MIWDEVFAPYGLFTRLELPKGIDTAIMLSEAVAQKLVYVPGKEFFVDGQPIRNNRMRVSFGGVPPEKILVGME